MPRSPAFQIRFTEKQLRIIEKLMKKLGFRTRAGLIKHAIAKLAAEEKIRLKDTP